MFPTALIAPTRRVSPMSPIPRLCRISPIARVSLPRPRTFLPPPLLLLAGLLLVCAGCAERQVPATGFLSDYAPLHPSAEDASIYFSDPATSAGAKTHVILLRSVQVWPDASLDAALAQEMCQVFAERLRLRVLEQVKGNILVVDKVSDLEPYRAMPGVGIVVVDCALTHMGDGLGAARYLVGFGLGDAQVTVEARAILLASDVHETHQMVVFAHSHGNPYGGLNPRCLFAPYCLRLACDSAADKIAKHLAARMAVPEPKWWEHQL